MCGGTNWTLAHVHGIKIPLLLVRFLEHTYVPHWNRFPQPHCQCAHTCLPRWPLPLFQPVHKPYQLSRPARPCLPEEWLVLIHKHKLCSGHTFLVQFSDKTLTTILSKYVTSIVCPKFINNHDLRMCLYLETGPFKGWVKVKPKPNLVIK